MNADFPRIITLLRKERGLSQKKAAGDLGISQALLSHYEKGIRECGLDFLVRTADYYHVSCDYLLGRSPEPDGNTLALEDIPELDASQKENRAALSGMMASFHKKLVVNAVSVLYELVARCGSDTLTREASSFLMLAVYKMFRIVHSMNTKNDPRLFTIPEAVSGDGASAAMSLSEAGARFAAFEGRTDNAEEAPLISAASLSGEYPAGASSLLNVVKNGEAAIQRLVQSQADSFPSGRSSK